VWGCQGVPVRKVAVSAGGGQQQCFAVTGPTKLHGLTPDLFALYSDTASGRVLDLPPVATFQVTCIEQSSVESGRLTCRPAATLCVQWAMPHSPQRDVIIIHTQTPGYDDFLYRTEVPLGVSNGSLLVRVASCE
jgi:hypothetical protein